MKSLPKVKLGQVQVSLNIAQNHSSKSGHYLTQFTWKVDQKVKLGQIQVGSNIAQNHSSSP